MRHGDRNYIEVADRYVLSVFKWYCAALGLRRSWQSANVLVEDVDEAACQSRERMTGRPSRAKREMYSFSTGTTSSPAAIPSEPPGQKSFCTSTTSSGSAMSSIQDRHRKGRMWACR